MENRSSGPLAGYVKKKAYLVCIDSDGCAMDTMDVKHEQCFGPCMVKEWELEQWSDDILFRWNQVNLYSMTRGINRFLALAMVLSEINDKYQSITDVESLLTWTEEADELSNDSLLKKAEATGSICLKKAFLWSEAVNRQIELLPEAVKIPFQGVKEGLTLVHRYADVAIVSSANPAAVEEEWNRHGLLGEVDILLAQNAGSKAYCIGALMEQGYDKSHVMMVGDAPGDLQAAMKNGVYFYPILVAHEYESWKNIEEALKHLTESSFTEGFQQQLVNSFEKNLKAE